MSRLTLLPPYAKRAGSMKSFLPLALATAALLPMAACNSHKAADDAANAAVAANEAAAANAIAAEMPPAIRADKTFRCKDNSLAYVTFFEGDKQAVVKDKQDGPATVLKADKAGDPLTAEGGWKLTGDEKAITLTRPGGAALSCHV